MQGPRLTRGHPVLRWGCITFWTNLILLVGLVSAFFGLHESQAGIRALLVGLRNSLTTRSSSDLGLFSSTPTELIRHHFYTDSRKVIDAWRPRLRDVVSPAADWSSLDETDRAKAIVLSFSKGGSSRPIYRMPL